MVGSLKRRVDAVEARRDGGFKPMTVVVQRADQTESEAVLAYEAKHGALNAHNNVLMVIVRKPCLVA